MEESVPASVHLSDWPQIMKDYVQEDELQEVAYARKVIGLTLRLRNEKQIKVRQPLSTIYILDDGNMRTQIKTVKKVILDETNVKTIEFIQDMDQLQETYLTLNFRKAGAVLGKELPHVKAYLDNVDTHTMEQLVKAHGNKESITIEQQNYAPELFTKQYRPLEHILTASEDQAVIGLSTAMSEELRLEGYMRDMVRHFQVFRKELDYELEQRIHIAIISEDRVIQEVMTQYATYLQQELLADTINTQPREYMTKKNCIYR